MTLRPVPSATPITFSRDLFAGVAAHVSRLTQQVKTMSVEQRVAEIVQLMDGSTTSGKEKRVRDIILSTPIADLHRLKRELDLGGEKHDLVNLIYDDIDNEQIRAEIRTFLKNNAIPTGELKVYSDIDDTFYSNWTDDRFEKGTIYPGVRAFYSALDKGKTDKDETGDLVFLSARPGFMEERTLAMLAKKGVSEASLLEGKLSDNFSLSVDKRNRNIAATKVENFTKHSDVYPDYSYVFIGDSGQGDAIAGAKMNQMSGKPQAVYIHNVTHMSAEEKAAMAKDGIFVFDSYLEAAIDAFKKGMISRQGLRDVRNAARAELDAMTADQLKPEKRPAAEAALKAAEAVEAAIPYPTLQATAA